VVNSNLLKVSGSIKSHDRDSLRRWLRCYRVRLLYANFQHVAIIGARRRLGLFNCAIHARSPRSPCSRVHANEKTRDAFIFCWSMRSVCRVRASRLCSNRHGFPRLTVIQQLRLACKAFDTDESHRIHDLTRSLSPHGSTMTITPRSSWVAHALYKLADVGGRLLLGTPQVAEMAFKNLASLIALALSASAANYKRVTCPGGKFTAQNGIFTS
jgi:hypothetical protein